MLVNGYCMKLVCVAHISTGAFIKIMISRLQTNVTNLSQRLSCTIERQQHHHHMGHASTD